LRREACRLGIDFRIPVVLKGTGMYVPEKVLTNDDLEKMVETSDEWITSRTGIHERHISDGELTSELAAKAGRAALESAGLQAQDVDMIIVGTNTPDTIFPGVGPKVQYLIGAGNAGAFDVQAGCTGCIYALTTAAAGIGSGLWKNVLVIGAEVLSRFLDWSDRNTCVLFGDGAGAAVLGAGEAENSVLAAELHAEGEKSDFIIFPGGAVEKPATHETVDAGEHSIKMKGNDVFKYVNTVLPPFLKRLCSDAGLEPGDVDWWIFHQANVRIIDGVLKRMKLDPDRSIVNLDRYGNTSAASIFLALHEGIDKGLVKKGDNVVLTSFGSGMTYGAIVLRI